MDSPSRRKKISAWFSDFRSNRASDRARPNPLRDSTEQYIRNRCERPRGIKDGGSQRSLTISMCPVYDGSVLLGGEDGKKPTEPGRKENRCSDGPSRPHRPQGCKENRRSDGPSRPHRAQSCKGGRSGKARARRIVEA